MMNWNHPLGLFFRCLFDVGRVRGLYVWELRVANYDVRDSRSSIKTFFNTMLALMRLLIPTTRDLLCCSGTMPLLLRLLPAVERLKSKGGREEKKKR